MTNKPRIIAGIINFRDYDCLPSCLESLYQQTHTPDDVLLVDNSSIPHMIKPIAEVHKDVRMFCQYENLGYTGGANVITQSAGICDYILLLNPDVVLLPDALEEMVRVMESNPLCGSVGGKLLLGSPPDSVSKYKGMSVIDSCGHLIYKNRRALDRGHGEDDNGQYDREEEVFSVCGAGVLYRKAMLEDAKIGEEYFDGDFFAYKEDVDVGWRSRLLGWKTIYTHRARLYHLRGLKETDPRSVVPWIIRYHSFKNHHLMLIKNELCPIFFQDICQITWLELRKLVYITLFEPKLWKAIADMRKYWPRALWKRREIMKKVKVTRQEIGRWFL